MLAIDDMDWPTVAAAWLRFREDGGGSLTHVVQSTGEYYADASVGNLLDATMFNYSFPLGMAGLACSNWLDYDVFGSVCLVYRELSEHGRSCAESGNARVGACRCSVR